jgi:hypothetical protein
MITTWPPFCAGQAQRRLFFQVGLVTLAASGRNDKLGLSSRGITLNRRLEPPDSTGGWTADSDPIY